jgi:hypothetical protein
MFDGDDAAAHAAYERAARIAERAGDPDLAVLSCLGRGQTLTHLGRNSEGMALLDEAMVEVTAGHDYSAPRKGVPGAAKSCRCCDTASACTANCA